MEKTELKSSYIFALINFFLFLIIFCFIFEATKVFLKELRLKEDFKLWILFLGGVFPLIFYTFIADLNNIYNKIQYFFFRHSFLNLLMPSILILLSLSYFLIPKIFKISFNKDIFIFLGGAFFTSHLIFVAKKNKGASFISFINYIFIFSMLYIFGLIILGIYLAIGFNLHLGKVAVDSIKNGFSLVRSIFFQLLP